MEVRNLNILLQDLERKIRGILGENIQLNLILGNLPEGIEIDLSQVEWVIMNLVANALSGMPDGGKITITTTDVMRIGRGPRKDEPFEPSMNRHAKLSMRYIQKGELKEQNFPMSLAIMNDILAKKGGEIWLSSDREREAVVHVFLPILPKDSEAQKAGETEKKIIKGSKWGQSFWRMLSGDKNVGGTGDWRQRKRSG